MLFGQIFGQDGLRGVESGMATQRKHLYHLATRSVKRSTLSYANANRRNEVFKSVYETMFTKGGIKVHVKLKHSGYIPQFVILTEAKRHEVKELPRFKLKGGDVAVFDRAYTDFGQFANY